MFQRLSVRLLLTYATLMLAGVGSLIVLAGWQITAQAVEQHANELQLQVQLIANAIREPLEKLDSNGEPAHTGRSLSDLTTSFAQNVDGRVTILDPQLNLIASSDTRVRRLPKSNHAELTAAQQGKVQSDIRWDDASREQRLFVAAPVVDEHATLVGYVQLSVPTAPIYATIGRTWLLLNGIGGGVLLATILASILLARQIAVPVQHLTTTSEAIAAGKLNVRVAPQGPDEIRRLGVAFNRMAERVQAMLAQQREFVDNAAHEFRSPLTSLRLRIEMLQSHGEKNPELRERYLGQMAREVEFLQRLVDHLLALASVEGSENTARTPLDLAPLLYEMADSVEPVVHNAGIAWQTNIPDHLPCVLANAEQMNILIRNLIDNAIKYSPPGGTITLGAQTTGAEIAISVSDTGVGIPAEALPHVFDRFYRVDGARSRDLSTHAGGGAGIGLSLVRAIAEAHGGRVTVQSRVNAGSVFTVYLPVK